MSRLPLVAVSVVYAFATGGVLAELAGGVVGNTTTYAAQSAQATVLALAAGCALLTAVVVKRVALPAGICWLAPVWTGWIAGPHPVRSVAMAVAPFLLPAVAHLVLGRPWKAAYAAAAAVSLGRALFRSPFYDPHCWDTCGDNVFLLVSLRPVAVALDLLWALTVAVLGALLAVTAATRLARASPIGRRDTAPILLPGAAAGLAFVAYGVAATLGSPVVAILPPERPDLPHHLAIFLFQAATLTTLALGVLWTAVRLWSRRTAVARLTEDLGAAPPPGSLRAALARATGDRTLTVAYWLPVTRTYVDDEGHPVDVSPGPGRTATALTRRGEPVAMVLHDVQTDVRLGPAARLAIDNERLRAEVLAHLEHLRASRARIVESGDLARRDLERDLHDGAQQRLLAVTYQLRLAGQNDALEEALTALRELRELAHGIFPAILQEAGLEAALWSLADQAPGAVDIEDVPAVRLPQAVERAVYLVVKHAVETATGPLTVAVPHHGDTLTLDISGPVAPLPDHLVDRFGASGGQLTATHDRLSGSLPAQVTPPSSTAGWTR
ncbi:sensor histidine kinase [Nonomuraea sp. NPDC059194]|uniref:sensor histidine kinase n=1 Tax=Nonomuraea sp. NPDC059194 TaxID=3346764 RepID=UPI003682A570